MQNLPGFVKNFLKEAKALLKSRGAISLLFSRGTYQVEVREKGKKKAYPFLQLQDDGTVLDFFCSCKTSDAEKGCVHLAAGYLKIFNDFEAPLHVRFKHSLWNKLFQIAARRYGYENFSVRKQKKGFSFAEETEKSFSLLLELADENAKKRFDSLLFKKAVETEETSIKFSNLPLEELALYKKGEPSHSLRYELSFWSDLAKWCMELQEAKEKYQITFVGDALPRAIEVEFTDFFFRFLLHDSNWPWIIPSLAMVNSPLSVYEKEDNGIETIHYDGQEKKIKITHKSGFDPSLATGEGIAVGNWRFIPKKGFYRTSVDPFLKKEEIEAAQIAKALFSCKELEEYLPIDREAKRANYHLFFDGTAQLHIEMYLFSPGDLSQGKSALFPPWVYMEEKGFILLEDWAFDRVETVIEKEKIPEFLSEKRVWLENFEGFHTHLGSFESHLTYHFTQEGDLQFEAELNFPQESGEVLHFDAWVYIRGEGFYMKKEGQSKFAIHPGLKIAAKEISSFITEHKEELEQVQHFFSMEPLFQRAGLKIALNENEQIVISALIEYSPDIDAAKIERFGNYLYFPSKGFSFHSPFLKLPEKYRQEAVLPASAESSFLAYELEELKPYILEMDPRLKKPETLELKVRSLERKRRKGGEEWIAGLVYVSEIGKVDPFSIFLALQERKKHLFSPAGLLFLKEPRFQWIRQLIKLRFDREKKTLRLRTLEWMRLTLFEEPTVFDIHSPEGKAVHALMQELQDIKTDRLLKIDMLKATLRPYQETGLQWLWFLYCHGLSGLLCDDMGLGKTHQTMALLSAIASEDVDRKNKYLVVCPTSVIYHWQDLLNRFLPDIRVLTYYGLERSLEHFQEKYDLVLTSYGILRAGKDDLRRLFFEIAIFDEIQIAKNQNSQTHRALRTLSSNMRLGLTGTPIENRLRELKALVDLVLPSYLPSEALFREFFILPIEKEQDARAKELLQRLVRPFILRRKKGEVLRDLPEKIEEIAYTDLSEEQKNMYQEITTNMKERIYPKLSDESEPVPYTHIFSFFSQLKRLCDHPSLILGDRKAYLEHSSGKWDLFTALLEEALASGQKVVVFSQYLDMIAIIEAHLKRHKVRYATIQGATKHRDVELKKFREDPECVVFVASLLAAGVGIDLTVASIVIHYDRWWNPAKENQATDRVHRIGQNRGVQVFKLVTKNTIEEHIHQMIERKKGLQDLVTTEDGIQFLDRKELLEIFQKIYTA